MEPLTWGFEPLCLYAEPSSGRLVELGTFKCGMRMCSLGNLNLSAEPLWNLEPFECGGTLGNLKPCKCGTIIHHRLERRARYQACCAGTRSEPLGVRGGWSLSPNKLEGKILLTQRISRIGDEETPQTTGIMKDAPKFAGEEAKGIPTKKSQKHLDEVQNLLHANSCKAWRDPRRQDEEHGSTMRHHQGAAKAGIHRREPS